MGMTADMAADMAPEDGKNGKAGRYPAQKTMPEAGYNMQPNLLRSGFIFHFCVDGAACRPPFIRSSDRVLIMGWIYLIM